MVPGAGSGGEARGRGCLRLTPGCALAVGFAVSVVLAAAWILAAHREGESYTDELARAARTVKGLASGNVTAGEEAAAAAGEWLRQQPGLAASWATGHPGAAATAAAAAIALLGLALAVATRWPREASPGWEPLTIVVVEPEDGPSESAGETPLTPERQLEQEMAAVDGEVKRAAERLKEEMWFAETMDVVGDGSNMMSILLDPKLTVFREASLAVFVVSFASYLVNMWVQKRTLEQLTEVYVRDERVRANVLDGRQVKIQTRMDRFLLDHDTEGKYASIGLRKQLAQVLVPVLEDVPSALLNTVIIWRHGLTGTQLTVLLMSLLSLLRRMGELRAACEEVCRLWHATSRWALNHNLVKAAEERPPDIVCIREELQRFGRPAAPLEWLYIEQLCRLGFLELIKKKAKAEAAAEAMAQDLRAAASQADTCRYLAWELRRLPTGQTLTREPFALEGQGLVARWVQWAGGMAEPSEGKVLVEPAGRVRRAAVQELAKQGARGSAYSRSVAACLEDTYPKGRKPEVAQAAKQALLQFHRLHIGKEALEALAGTLQSESKQARHLAVEGLQELGREAGHGAGVAAAVAALLDEDDETLQRRALSTLEFFQEFAAPHLGRVAAALRSSSVQVCLQALGVLHGLLEPSMVDVDWPRVGEAVLEAIERHGGDEAHGAKVLEKAVKVLSEVLQVSEAMLSTSLRHKHAAVRRAAALAVEEHDKLKKHLGEVTVLLQDKDKEALSTVCEHTWLNKELADQYVGSVAALVEPQTNVEVLRKALGVLARFCYLSSSVAAKQCPRVAAVLTGESWREGKAVREAAVRALARMLRLAQEVAKEHHAATLASVLRDSNEDLAVRQAAFETFSELQSLATPYAREITDMLQDENVTTDGQQLGELAAKLLGSLPAGALEHLGIAFESRSLAARRNAVRAINVCGQGAQAAQQFLGQVAALVDSVSDPPETRLLATRTLRMFRYEAAVGEKLVGQLRRGAQECEAAAEALGALARAALREPNWPGLEHAKEIATAATVHAAPGGSGVACQACVAAMVEFGKHAKKYEIVPLLQDCEKCLEKVLRSRQDDGAVASAVKGLLKLGLARAHLQEFGALLRSSLKQATEKALEAIAEQAGEVGAEIVDAVVELLAGQSFYSQAATALSQFAEKGARYREQEALSESSEVVARVLQMCAESPSTHSRWKLLEALRPFSGAALAPSVGRIAEECQWLPKDKRDAWYDRRVKASASLLEVIIRGQQLSPEVAHQLLAHGEVGNDSRLVRETVTRALGEAWDVARPDAAELAELLEARVAEGGEQDPAVLAATCVALGRFKGGGRRALLAQHRAALERLRGHGSEAVRQAAEQALGDLGR